jgi:CCR4-NOT transcription complex subunit 1
VQWERLIWHAPVLPEGNSCCRIWSEARAVTEGCNSREFDAPPDSILDRVQFLSTTLRRLTLEGTRTSGYARSAILWLAWSFSVVKRISTQANFHSIYLSFLDNLGEYGKGLVEAILASVYHSIGKLLRSPKITTSSGTKLSEESGYLAQITLP